VIPTTPGEVTCLLEGCLIGAVAVLLLTFIAAGIQVWRAGWREGTPLVGEELERNRKRGAL
jgi:hypothetical protein